MWIARDCNGELRIYRTKPTKYPDIGVWISSDVIGIFIDKCNATDILFSEVKWEDEDPRELVLKPIKDEQP